MVKLIYLYFFLAFCRLSSQNLIIEAVEPSQHSTSASNISPIIVTLNNLPGSIISQKDSLFRINGNYSGRIKGRVDIIQPDQIKFTPERKYHPNELIKVGFGPVITENDTLKVFHWNFTTKISHPTDAHFDSMATYDNPAYFPIPYDIDSDSDIDLISANGYVHYNDGMGTFYYNEPIDEFLDISFITDLDNNGTPDIICSKLFFSSQVNIFLQDTLNNYNLNQTIYPYNQNWGEIISVGDLDGDNFSDLIGLEMYNETDFQFRSFFNNKAGLFIRDDTAYQVENFISDGDLVDMDNDGDLDFVFLNTFPANLYDFEGMYIFFNDSNGNFNNYMREYFKVRPNGIILNGMEKLHVADFDLNGLPDVAGFGNTHGGAVLLQESLNEFNLYLSTRFSGAENSGYFCSGDMNGDDRPDAVISNLKLWGCDTCVIRFQISINCEDDLFSCSTNQGGFFNLGYETELGLSVIPGIADFDNDGDLDIVHCGEKTSITFNKNVISSVTAQNVNNIKEFNLRTYPNPFNSETVIEYYLPSSGEIRIDIYNILGEKISSIVDAFENGGIKKRIINGINLPAGVYLIVSNFSNRTFINKIVLLK